MLGKIQPVRLLQNCLRQKRIFLIFLFCFIVTVGFAYAQDVEKARQHYKQGEIYYEQGRYKEANEEFQKALELLEKKEEIHLLKEKKAIISKEPGLIKEEIKPQTEEKEVAISKQPEVIKQEAPQKDYVIDQGDVLYISVWENPDLNQEVIVRPDGKVSFPFIDEIRAEGQTILELDKEITDRLKEYIRSPDVSISLRKMSGSKVVILGQVRSPGVYSLTGRKTILEAISLAGGFTNDAVISSIIVVKADLNSHKAQRVNLNKAIKEADAKENIALNSEDVVFVPRKFIADVNYFLSQILEPISKGAYTAKEFQRW